MYGKHLMCHFAQGSKGKAGLKYNPVIITIHMIGAYPNVLFTLTALTLNLNPQCNLTTVHRILYTNCYLKGTVHEALSATS